MILHNFSGHTKRSFGSVFLSLPNALAGIGLAIFAASWLVAEHFRPWLSFHSEFVAFFALAVLVLGVLMGRSGAIAVPVVCAPILVVAVVPLLQWMMKPGFFAGDMILSVLYLLVLAFALLVGYLLRGSSESEAAGLPPLAMAITVAALLSAGIAWFQWLGVDDNYRRIMVSSEIGRAGGNLAQPNHLATLLLVGLSAYAYLFARHVIGRFTFAFGVAFISIALAMTQSRTGILSASAIAVFWAFKCRNIAPRRSAFLLFLWVAVTFAVTRTLPFVSDALFITSGALPRSIGDNGSRLDMWWQVAIAIAQSPWLGYGWNQTFTAQTVGALAHPGELAYLYAHNIVLDLIAWSGIPLGLLIVTAICYWFCSRLARVQSIEGVFAIAALIPIALHSLLEYPFAYAYFLVAAGLLMGVAEASLPRLKTLAIARAWVGAVFGLWAVAGLWVAYEYVQIEADYRIVRFETLRIGTTPSSYSAPKIRLLSHMKVMLLAARVAVKPGMAADEIELLRKAASRFPYGLLSYKYAVTLALNGELIAASRQMAVLRGVFGEEYYAQSKAAFRRLGKEKFPQLTEVSLP